ncbi:MAG: alanine--glyoxylate aminotransferase family protein [Dehalococcoidia bacterium]|nr:alanine--glyoxylate aminotransferase family protein [Dehalococcoidia bacterium]
MNLRIPGPTPCPPQVLEAMGRQMINHRGSEFTTLLKGLLARLKTICQTEGEVFIFTCSGTGGMEAALVNTLSPGDHVLSLTNGAFGDRFARIAEAFGGQMQKLNFEWGQPLDPQAVKEALQGDPLIKIVLVTHNETSTGVTNDLSAIGAVVREFDKLLLVDAVSSLGAIDLPMDRWGCDVVVTGSQKSWMVPPGLAMVAVRPRAWKAVEEAKSPRFYWDFRAMKRFQDNGETPFTPAISLYFALAVALDAMEKEGFANVVARHARVAAYARSMVKEMGLALFPREEYASNTVTAVKKPDGIEVKTLLKTLREQHDVVLAGGQGKLDGSIFRIGHLGYVNEQDMEGVAQALKATLPGLKAKA